jgi:uncharacterized protein (DUF488 family)
MPFSQYSPHFNMDALQSTLDENQILYVHFGKEFGARLTKPSLLDDDGKVDFDKVRQTPDFLGGIQRLKDAIQQGYEVALLCSEGDPLDCHRFSMISYQLSKEGFNIVHILSDGMTITNEELERRMLEKYSSKLPVSTLFETVTPEMQLEAAYRLLGKKVAYSVKSQITDNEVS